jgi:hypothetical protein
MTANLGRDPMGLTLKKSRVYPFLRRYVGKCKGGEELDKVHALYVQHGSCHLRRATRVCIHHI